jgi:galactitol-specific phosphotransferase system IIC component
MEFTLCCEEKSGQLHKICLAAIIIIPIFLWQEAKLHGEFVYMVDGDGLIYQKLSGASLTLAKDVAQNHTTQRN